MVLNFSLAYAMPALLHCHVCSSNVHVCLYLLVDVERVEQAFIRKQLDRILKRFLFKVNLRTREDVLELRDCWIEEGLDFFLGRALRLAIADI